MVLLTKNISFCDAVCQNIVGADYKQRVLDELDGAFSTGVVRKHHVRLDADSLERVRKLPHVVCLRSNGNPYYLYHTRFNMKNICIFIDKKIQNGYTLPRMVIAPFQFDDALFDGSVIDGEMVRDDAGNWVFLANDMFGFAGRNMSDVILPDRLRVLHETLETRYRPCGNDICSFQLKRFFKVTELRSLFDNFARQLAYTNRGVLFKPLYRRFPDVLYNFDDSLITRVQKSKIDKARVVSAQDLGALAKGCGGKQEPAAAPMQPTSSQSLSDSDEEPQVFRIYKGTEPDTYKVYRENTDVGVLHVKNLAQSLDFRTRFINQPINRYVEMPCSYDKKFNKWGLA